MASTELRELAELRHPAIVDVVQFFDYDHLPEHLRDVSKIFHDAACILLKAVRVDSPSLTRALTDLLVAKDHAVRAKLADR